MQIEIGAPASLPLAAIRFDDGSAGLLGVTLQHPPLNLSARRAHALNVEGARGELAWELARRFLRARQLPEQGEIEIELTAPSHMGLGSDATLALGVAEALAWVHNQPRTDTAALAEAVGLGPEWALETHGYAQGGLLLVEAPWRSEGFPKVLRRYGLTHKPEEAWAFVLHLPRVPAGEPDSLETDRRAALLCAIPHLSPETGRLLEGALWPALEGDDLPAFAAALQAIQALNDQALAAANVAAPLSDETRSLLALCAANGAAVTGQSAGGLALYALIRGKTPSIDLRKALVNEVGYYGGVVMAAITDNQGAQNVVHDLAPIYTEGSPLVRGTGT